MVLVGVYHSFNWKHLEGCRLNASPLTTPGPSRGWTEWAEGWTMWAEEQQAREPWKRGGLLDADRVSLLASRCAAEGKFHLWSFHLRSDTSPERNLAHPRHTQRNVRTRVRAADIRSCVRKSYKCTFLCLIKSFTCVSLTPLIMLLVLFICCINIVLLHYLHHVKCRRRLCSESGLL